MNEITVEVLDVGKKFSRDLRLSMVNGLKDIWGALCKKKGGSVLRAGEFWSLKNINFKLEKGDSLGVIGKNGSGKTTLLRLLNGIYPPSQGFISIKGRTAALIAVGAGFHPNLTGRENIYLNSSILGMSRNELNLVFDEIIKFADIDEFIDAPISTYSSGMTVRLGFSIAIHSNPDILLADEILAVGDLAFVLKCHRKIAEFQKKGGILILVAHSMQLIRNTCSKVLWLDKGEIKAYGDVNKVCDEYEKYVLMDGDSSTSLGVVVSNDDEVIVETVTLNGRDAANSPIFELGKKAEIKIYYQCLRVVKNPIVTLGILNAENILIIANYSSNDSGGSLNDMLGRGYVSFVIESLDIKPGEYFLTFSFCEESLSNVLQWQERNFKFKVFPTDDSAVMYGLYQPKAIWGQSVSE
jgi:lipopolysaccharide transport system ATP-binding protein